MRITFLLLILFSYFAAQSQAVIGFEKTTHDFGNIKEVDGEVVYDFLFTNKGNAPIIVKNVESSCGCTSPEWSKQPILPGRSGYIKAKFDPKDRPGYFDKTITVHSNARNAIVELKIKGSVESKTRTALDDYPYELPSGIRLPFDHIALMMVKKGATKSVAVKVYNNSGKSIHVNFTKLPAHLKIAVEPTQIPVKGTAVFNVEYNTTLHGAFGLNTENVLMSVDGKNYPLPVSIFIEEDFSRVNATEAPAIQVEKRYHNFGTIVAGQKYAHRYQLTNTGQSVLKIHRCYSSDENVSLSLLKNELAPGESTELIAEINQITKPGKISASISVISNSPLNSEMKLRFYGDLK